MELTEVIRILNKSWPFFETLVVELAYRTGCQVKDDNNNTTLTRVTGYVFQKGPNEHI